MSNIQYANVWKCKIEPESARSRRIARHFFPIAASTVDTVPDRAGADKDSVREIWREREGEREEGDATWCWSQMYAGDNYNSRRLSQIVDQ